MTEDQISIWTEKASKKVSKLNSLDHLANPVDTITLNVGHILGKTRKLLFIFIKNPTIWAFDAWVRRRWLISSRRPLKGELDN